MIIETQQLVCVMINSVMLAGARGGKVERRLTLGSVLAARARYS